MPKQDHIQAKVKGLFKVLYIDLQCVAWTQSPYSTDMATVGRDSILLIVHSSHQGRLCSQALSAEGNPRKAGEGLLSNSGTLENSKNLKHNKTFKIPECTKTFFLPDTLSPAQFRSSDDPLNHQPQS